MPKVWIDGRSRVARPEQNMLEVALIAGYDLPFFCWHPAMGSIGACRQCAVKLYSDEHAPDGQMVMACMLGAADGTRISVADPEARAFRASVIEWLMVGHPHDCPVCDEGGECHLQDMTVMTGHVYRRYRFRKRTFRNQDLGPLINHEMNRCIVCYRCVRFYRELAGGRDLHAMAAHEYVYFGRHTDGKLESPFSGNLVEICPTGVFNDKTHKAHYTRKWDLQTAPSVCSHCSLGCNVTPGERYGTLRRVRARYHSRINGYFICDRGRYGYGYTNAEERLTAALVPRGKDALARPISRPEAVARFAEILDRARGVIGIGSPRTSVETNFALASLVGSDYFYAGVCERELTLVTQALAQLKRADIERVSLADIESCDTVVIVGEDLTGHAPMADFAVRQAVYDTPLQAARDRGIAPWHDAALRRAVENRAAPLFIVSALPTGLDAIAEGVCRRPPGQQLELLHATARQLTQPAPVPASPSHAPDADDARLARRMAHQLARAERPVIITGTGCGHASLLRAAADLASTATRVRSGHPVGLFCVLPECNSAGLAQLTDAGLTTATQALVSGAADTVVVAEVDLMRRASPTHVDHLLEHTRALVVVDSLAHDTAAAADLVLPAATGFESTGTFINNELRAQRSYQVYPPADPIQPTWRWLRAAAEQTRHHPGRTLANWSTLADVSAACARAHPILEPIANLESRFDTRIAGALHPRKPHRYSGRTAMTAHRDVVEPTPPVDPDSPLRFSMEGAAGPYPARLASHFWAPGWSSIQALTRFQEEINGPLRGGDPGLRLTPEVATAPPPPLNAKGLAHELEAQERWVVSRFHLFGSDGLSALAEPTASLTPSPGVWLHPDDAAALALQANSEAQLVFGDTALTLPVRLDAGIATDTVAVSIGPLGLTEGRLPERAKLHPAPTAQPGETL